MSLAWYHLRKWADEKEKEKGKSEEAEKLVRSPRPLPKSGKP